ncbi:MAG: glycosyltransferase family 4 protein [Clostridium sp.]
MKKFTLYMPNMGNYLLTKDVGLIPFIMQKYQGYKSEILAYNIHDELYDNKTYLENLEVNTIKSEEDILFKLRNTDVLMMIGIYEYNIHMINTYKSVNPLGKVYLKLDANLYWLSNINKNMNEGLLSTLRKCDLISVESRRLQHSFNSMWGLRMEFILNGYYNFISDEIINYEDKKNTIMFAGRVGSPEKNNQLLLEAFKNIEDKIKEWNIELVGSVEENFKAYLNSYFNENPHLIERVKLTGALDKMELKERYKKAKVFCLTSSSEGCANVFSESVSNGCYLIASDLDCAIDIIDYGRYGRVFPVNNRIKLEEALLDTCSNDELLKKNCVDSQIYAKNNLSWIKICEDIDKLYLSK